MILIFFIKVHDPVCANAILDYSALFFNEENLLKNGLPIMGGTSGGGGTSRDQQIIPENKTILFLSLKTH